MVTPEELEFAIARSYEERGIEFKGSRPRSDKLFFARVARAAMGMSNRRDGGRVVVGVDEAGGVLVPTGLSPKDLSTWKYDDVAAGLAEYADPNLTFDLNPVSLDGKQYVVLRIYEFEEAPTLCSKDFQQTLAGRNEVILRRGACYVRSRSKPETSEVPSQDEMRELLELAIDKGVRRFLTRAHNVGLSPQLPGAPSPSDAELFEKQLGELA